MAFFDSFTLLKKKSGIVVQYKKSTLATIKPDVLRDMILDHIPKKVLQEAVEHITPSAITRKSNTLAIKLMTEYNARRKKYHGNRRIKEFTSKSREFKYFVQAAEIMKNHRIHAGPFLDAQIKGLSFVNDGAGTFPKPNQLATVNAEERVLAALQTEVKRNDPTEVERLDLRHSDRETELMQNPRFVSRYNKLKDGTATLQDAYFVHDCMLERKGNVTQFVTEYIEDLLND